jgi:RHS repeat-associated protein
LTEADYLAGLLDEGEVFGMDDLGNRTTVNLRSGLDQVYMASTPNLTNRYTTIDSQPLAYDEAGNLTQDHDGYHYVYDYENRVARIYKMDGQTEVGVAQYVYDALGRRIGKWDAMAGKATYYFYNDKWQVLCEHNGTAFGNRYIYGNYIDEPLVMSDGSDDYYYAHDHLYSTVALVDNLGQTIERYEYDVYGTVHIMDASYAARTASTYNNPYTFTGRQLDMLDGGDLLRMHYRHRDYDAFMGRFLQHDPLGINPASAFAGDVTIPYQFLDGVNLYMYVAGNPIVYSDPLGQLKWIDVLKILKKLKKGIEWVCFWKKCSDVADMANNPPMGPAPDPDDEKYKDNPNQWLEDWIMWKAEYDAWFQEEGLAEIQEVCKDAVDLVY